MYRYIDCRWPFPQRITGDGHERLMYGIKTDRNSANHMAESGISPLDIMEHKQILAGLKAQGRVLLPKKWVMNAWFPEHEEILKQLYGKKLASEISRLVGHSEAAVIVRARRLGLRSTLMREMQGVARGMKERKNA